MTEIVVASELDECERVIERGLATFVDVGRALLRIRDERLYRERHETFEDYCQARWNFNRHRASQLISAVGVVTNVTVAGLPAPVNEGQARELARVPAPERAEVWHEAHERTGGKPTAAVVREIREQRAARAPVASDPVDEPGSAVGCEKCGGPIAKDEAAIGYRRCEGCDPDGDHAGDPDGPCRGCQPEPDTDPVPPALAEEIQRRVEAQRQRVEAEAEGRRWFAEINAQTTPETKAWADEQHRRIRAVLHVVECCEELMQRAGDPAQVIDGCLEHLRPRLSVVPSAAEYLTRFAEELEARS